MTEKVLLGVHGLEVDYHRGRKAGHARALDDVSLDIRPGEAMGLVGESGSGKTTLGRAILGLAPVTAGRIEFEGRDITRLTRAQRRSLADDMQVVFQDPFGSLAPTLTVGRILAEPLYSSGVTRSQGRQAVYEALDRVHLPRDAADRYPHEFSGGQRQRIAIARAIVRKPKLIVCDEPVTAVDVTTRSRLLSLFLELQEEIGVAYLFISHDLHVVRRLCHRVTVIHHGRLVESGPADVITSAPQAAYTKRLLAASLVPDPRVQRARRPSGRSADGPHVTPATASPSGQTLHGHEDERDSGPGERAISVSEKT